MGGMLVSSVQLAALRSTTSPSSDAHVFAMAGAGPAIMSAVLLIVLLVVL
jgi:hypothetical protein